jgi:hypothetical protein
MELINKLALTLNITFGLYHAGLFYRDKKTYDLILASLNISAVIFHIIY